MKVVLLLLGAALLVAAVAFLGVVVLGVATVVIVYTVARRILRWHRAQSALVAHRRAELLARAELQHRRFVAGDPRGTYGRYTPAA